MRSLRRREQRLAAHGWRASEPGVGAVMNALLRQPRAKPCGLTCSLSNQAEEAKSGGKDIKKEERQNKTRSRALRFGRLERRGGTLEALRNQLVHKGVQKKLGNKRLVGRRMV